MQLYLNSQWINEQNKSLAIGPLYVPVQTEFEVNCYIKVASRARLSSPCSRRIGVLHSAVYSLTEYFQYCLTCTSNTFPMPLVYTDTVFGDTAFFAVLILFHQTFHCQHI